MVIDNEQFTRGVTVAAIGIVVGLVTTFTSMSLTNSSKISNLEADVRWIKEGILRIEKVQREEHKLPDK